MTVLGKGRGDAAPDCRSNGSPRPRLAYLASRYPGVTHTFIAREVAELRRLGFDIETIAVREAAPDEVLCEADRQEQRNTHVLVPPTAATLLTAHGRALATHPRAYLATISHALRLSAGGLRAGLWQLFYFGEAILLWRHCRRRGIGHVHVHFANVGADVAMLAAHFSEAARSQRSSLSWSFTMHSQVAQQTDGATDYYDVVRCGVDVREFHPRDRSAAEDGCARILAVGRLLPLKGHALLLEAAAQLLAGGAHLQVTIVGDGPERARLERLSRELGIESHVRFAGAVGRDKLAGHYSEADIFCLPSFAEGVPVVLMEAMAAGLPVVATRVGGIPELVRDEETGLLVYPGRPDLLADALRRLMESGPLRRSLSEAGRSWVAAEFEIGRSARRLETVIRGAARAPRAQMEPVSCRGAQPPPADDGPPGAHAPRRRAEPPRRDNSHAY